MSLTRDKLRAEIDAGKFRPVYVLYGEETFLRDNAATFISRSTFGDGDFRDFNDDHFSLNIPENIAASLSAANQLPMMAARRIVRVTELRVSTSAAKDTLKEDAEAELRSYLADPNPNSTVIFVADELNGNRKLGKLLRAQPGAVEFRFPTDDETRRLAEGVFKKAGVFAEPLAVRRMVELVGCNARRITTESEKLATASFPERRVDARLVESLVRNAREGSNFDFANDLIAGRGADSVKSLEKALSDGEEPIALLGAMSWKFHDELKRSSQPRSKYAERLANALIKIANADLAIKTSVGGSGKASRKQIEMLVCAIAGG